MVRNIKVGCRSKMTENENGSHRDRSGGNIVLFVGESKGSKDLRAAKNDRDMEIGADSITGDGDWTLDSNFSRHLVNDPTLLQDARDREQECHLSDGDQSAAGLQRGADSAGEGQAANCDAGRCFLCI